MPDLVLITRPAEESLRTAERLKEKGYSPLIDPMLEYQEIRHNLGNVAPESNLVFTSAQAVRTYCRHIVERNDSVFTVGDRTGDIARQSGFSKVFSAGGNAAALQVLLEQQEAGTFLYLRGAHITANLPGLVPKHTWKEHILYDTVAKKNLSVPTREAILEGHLSYAVFFSRRTAQAFVQALEQAPEAQALKTGLKRTTFLCLSEGVLECLSSLPFAQAHRAKEPTFESLMALLPDNL
jgi:uroporphyrinogen-III synthase